MLAGSEIDEHRLIVGGNKDICRFNIEMPDMALVNRDQRIHDLLQILIGHGLRQRFLLDYAGQ